MRYLILFILIFAASVSGVTSQNASPDSVVYVVSEESIYSIDSTTGDITVVLDKSINEEIYGRYNWLPSIPRLTSDGKFAVFQTGSKDYHVLLFNLTTQTITELPIEVSPEFAPAYFTWLPNNKFLVATYFDYDDFGVSVLAWRQMWKIYGEDIEAIPFPYTCTHFDREPEEVFLYCDLVEDIAPADENFSAHARYSFIDGEISYVQEANGVELTSVEDLEHANWDWSSQYGILYTRPFGTPKSEGLVHLDVQTGQENQLIGSKMFHADFKWANNSPHFLVRSGYSFKEWYVYSFEEKKELLTIEPDDLWDQPVFVNGDDSIAYVTCDGIQENYNCYIHVIDWNSQQEDVFTLDPNVKYIFSPDMSP